MDPFVAESNPYRRQPEPDARMDAVNARINRQLLADRRAHCMTCQKLLVLGADDERRVGLFAAVARRYSPGWEVARLPGPKRAADCRLEYEGIAMK